MPSSSGSTSSLLSLDACRRRIADLEARLREAEETLEAIRAGEVDALVVGAEGGPQRVYTLQTADRHPSKPDPSMVIAAMAEAGAAPETTVVIGDTSFDILMAGNAGIAAFGVAWGHHPAEELTAAGARAVARDFPELSDLIEEWAA